MKKYLLSLAVLMLMIPVAFVFTGCGGKGNSDPIHVVGIAIIGPSIVEINESVTFTASVAPYNATDKQVAWAIEYQQQGNSSALIGNNGSFSSSSAGHFVIKATADGVSASHSITVVPRAVTPPAPQNVIATPGNGQVTLSWSPPVTDGGAAITQYQYSTNGGTSWSTMPGNYHFSATITGFTNGTSYTFIIRAVNRVGSGVASTSVTATPQA